MWGGPPPVTAIDNASGVDTNCMVLRLAQNAGLRMTGLWNGAKLCHFGTLSTVILLIRLFFAFICLYNPTKLREY
jgi:hypothetical protein